MTRREFALVAVSSFTWTARAGRLVGASATTTRAASTPTAPATTTPAARADQAQSRANTATPTCTRKTAPI